MTPRTPALLALADGRIFKGYAAGAIHSGPVAGEVVFNTSMSGYQEVVSDPSYCGQMVTMTYPHQGNYGINAADAESNSLYLSGFIVREMERLPSNFRSEESLDDYLKRHNVAAIEGIDTRALTRHIRDHGAQQGVIVSGNAVADEAAAVAAAQAVPSMVGQDLAQVVTCDSIHTWSTPTQDIFSNDKVSAPAKKFKVVAYDYGIKHNILRMLTDRGCEVTVVPADTPAGEVMAMGPDGLFLSNGPGDPEAVGYAVDRIKRLLNQLPVFGICLGHQLLCLALGASSFKMRFGHHGGNQPVMDLATRKVAITAQNHGFAIDPESLPDTLEVSHINLNDQTVEGVRHKTLPVFSVQYHPEAAPGPRDAADLFDRFIADMTAHQSTARYAE